MKTALSEQELINAIANRDHTIAAALLCDHYASTLLKIIHCSIKDSEKATSILEETITYIWNNFHHYHAQDKHLLLWMAGIARKQAGKNC